MKTILFSILAVIVTLNCNGIYSSNTYSKLNSCPSHLVNGWGGISQLRVQQDGKETVISNFTGQLLTLKDGSNTAELKEDITYSIPPEALALYNSLMAKSPYLSDTVMQTAVAKEYELPKYLVVTNTSGNIPATTIYHQWSSATLQAIDLQGKIVLQQEVANTGVPLQLDVSKLPAGMYQFRLLYMGKQVAGSKVVVR